MSGLSADLLSRCLDDVRSGVSSVEDCLSAYPEAGEELETLLRLALAIQSTPDTEPDPSFRARGRAQLLASIAAERQQQSAESALGRLRRAVREGWAAVVPAPRARRAVVPFALVLLLCFGSAGAVFAAQEALPGDALYGVKCAGEDLQLRLAATEESKLRLHIELADRRLAEMVRLAEENRLGSIGSVADAYAAHMEQATALAAGSANDEAEQERERAHERLMEQEQLLLQVQVRVPTAAQPALVRALAQVQQYDHGVRVGWQRKAATAEAAPTAVPSPSTEPQPADAPPAAADPEGELDQLVIEVQNLDGDEVVSGGSRQDLLAKLSAARDALDRDQTKVAANTLAAFAHHLNAMERSGHISDEDYEFLYGAYTRLVEQLGDTPIPMTASEKTKPKPSPSDAGSDIEDEPGGEKPGQGKGLTKGPTPTPTATGGGVNGQEHEEQRGPAGRP